jgi:1,4-alpha-glucan branching enzyme
MLNKKFLNGRKVEVTFRMPPLDDVVELNLCGDFNGWKVKGVPLVMESDGTWVAKLVLDAGRSYRFRYYDNQGSWHTDYEADAHVPNGFGSDDSVLDLTVTTKEPLKTEQRNGTKKASKPKGDQHGRKVTAGSQRSKVTR